MGHTFAQLKIFVKDPQIFDLIAREYHRQARGVELIASENYVSDQVMRAMGSVLTNKYAEGYPGRRYYGGCEVIDEVETLAIERLKQLFGASWVNVQPHSGAQANAAVMLACLKPGDTILGFNLSHGGHLTHGSPVNFSGKLYRAVFYGVERDTGLINYDHVEEIAQREKPRLIVCGASAYPRDWDYARLRKIADSVGAILLADIAHPAGLIAKGLLNNPLPHCHVASSTTHKTLRGPRGGVLLMGQDFVNPFGEKTPKGELKMMSAVLESAVFPGTQGGPLEHVIAAKAVAFWEALQPNFTSYVERVRANARRLGAALADRGYQLATGGTDNHLLLIDLRNKGLTGKEAETTLGKVHITVNKNMVPFDDKSPFVTSGIRLGTAAVTTRSLREDDMDQLAGWIDEALQRRHDDRFLAALAQEVEQKMLPYPLFQYE